MLQDGNERADEKGLICVSMPKSCQGLMCPQIVYPICWFVTPELLPQLLWARDPG